MRSRSRLVLLVAVLAGVAACKQSGSGSTAAPNATTPGVSSVAPAAVSAQPANGAASPGTGNTFTGNVAETVSSGGYTYARLQAPGRDDVWIAAPQFEARVGERLSASLDMPMQNFESRTLNRTFPLVYFVADVARDGSTPGRAQQGAPPALMTSHGAANARPAPPTVAKLDPPQGGLSIADVFAKRTALTGKTVTVRGTVVKVNSGILDRNWVHIQDGSGTPTANDNDLTITTDAQVAVGDVVTMSGVLGTNRNFGAGYAYDAIVENAVIKK